METFVKKIPQYFFMFHIIFFLFYAIFLSLKDLGVVNIQPHIIRSLNYQENFKIVTSDKTQSYLVYDCATSLT